MNILNYSLEKKENSVSEQVEKKQLQDSVMDKQLLLDWTASFGWSGGGGGHVCG